MSLSWQEGKSHSPHGGWGAVQGVSHRNGKVLRIAGLASGGAGFELRAWTLSALIPGLVCISLGTLRKRYYVSLGNVWCRAPNLALPNLLLSVVTPESCHSLKPHTVQAAKRACLSFPVSFRCLQEVGSGIPFFRGEGTREGIPSRVM